jgi:hypothetical protein
MPLGLYYVIAMLRRYDEKCSEQQNHQTFKDLADLVKATGATSFVDGFSAVKPSPAQRSSFFWFHPAGCCQRFTEGVQILKPPLPFRKDSPAEQHGQK